MSKGWVKFHRSMMDNDFWLAEPFTKAQAWVDIFANANHSPATFWVRDIEVKVDRGQLAWSELTMSKRWQWSRGKVRRYLGMLKSRGMIVQQTDNVTSVITVCNYRAFQDVSTPDNTPDGTAGSTPDGTANEHQTVHKQEEQELENEKNVKKTPAKSPDVVCGFDFKKWPEVPDKTIVSDWLKVRTAKKAKLTQTAVDRMAAEMHRATEQGISVNECIGYAVEKSWAGFKLAWMNDKSNGRAASGPSQGIDFSDME